MFSLLPCGLKHTQFIVQIKMFVAYKNSVHLLSGHASYLSLVISIQSLIRAIPEKLQELPFPTLKLPETCVMLFSALSEP